MNPHNVSQARRDADSNPIQQPQSSYRQTNPPQPAAHPSMRPGAHPDSEFSRLRATRRISTQDQPLTGNNNGQDPYSSDQQGYVEQGDRYDASYDAAGHGSGHNHDGNYAAQYGNYSARGPSDYAQHDHDQYGNDQYGNGQYGNGQYGNNPQGYYGVRDAPSGAGSSINGLANQYQQTGRSGQQLPTEGPYYNPAVSRAHNDPNSIVTPGADNFSRAASGGMAGIAFTVAERNARESGLNALHASEEGESGYASAGIPSDRSTASAIPLPRSNRQLPTLQSQPQQANYEAQDLGGLESHSYSSLTLLEAAAALPARATPDALLAPPGRISPFADIHHGIYRDDPYQGLSRVSQTNLGVFDPNDIDDDGDDGLDVGHQQRRSMLNMGSDRRGGPSGVGAVAAGAAGAASAIALSRRPGAPGGGRYDPIGIGTGYKGAGGLPRSQADWSEEKPGRKRLLKWVIIAVLVLVIVGAIIGGLVGGGVLKFTSANSNNDGGGGGGGLTAGQDTQKNGDLNSNSPEIQSLLNNPNLHKVFPGIDYTPINTQYPLCLTYPPSQNNVTRDIAVLSQLTNTIRLYGTDCNQTEMVVHAINQLNLANTMKVWLGVWQDNNVTTNARQLAQMYDILNTYGQSPFKGVIVANEILFREQMTSAELAQLLMSVKANFTAMNIKLPVATSDLGTTWDATINQASDYIMANIHPFFGGTPFSNAAAWTWNFWSTNDGQWWRMDKTKNIIAETGWPTSGGTDCGTATVTNCPNGAVASVAGLNQFLQDWVCQAITNETEYFWFEAFDEPWKISFDTPGAAWEDQWGLMDVNRNLKPGIKIPDCGGATVP